MITIVLYVALCTTPNKCDAYEPAVWKASSQEELKGVYKECAKEERQWMKVKGYKESDCFVK